MLPAFASFRQAQARSGASERAPERGVRRSKLDLATLAKFRASLPRSPLSSAVMVSKMRDEADGW